MLQIKLSLLSLNGFLKIDKYIYNTLKIFH